MTIDGWAGLALIAAVALPASSEAATLKFNFNGPDAISGSLIVSYKPSTNQGTLPSAPPNAFNPAGSYSIKGATGTFSVGGDTETVTGVASLNRVTPELTNLLAPHDFSLFLVANGVDDGSGHPSPGLHYDNLLYPNGSPQTATDYPFSGGIFDIYGLVFSIGNGDYVNIWSNGNTPGGLNYGVAITDGTDVLGYTGGVSLSVVPLPASAPMFGMALLGLAGVGYAVWRRKASAA